MRSNDDIDRLIDMLKGNLVCYLDENLYLPMKEELIGIEHSLGIRKELFKAFLELELEKLRSELKNENGT